MKKSKKDTKKTTRYNGYNVFGERCIAKTVTLQKDTALKQYLDMLDDIDSHPGEIIEYTFYLSKDITKEDADAIYAQIERISALRAMMTQRKFVQASVRLSPDFPKFAAQSKQVPLKRLIHLFNKL